MRSERLSTGLSTLVRAPMWWTAKLLPLVAAAELAALTADVPGADGTVRIVAMLVSAMSVAAGAHVVNDLADRSSDAVAGKPNAMATASAGARIALLTACALGAVLPWTLVPLDPGATGVLCLLVVLSISYSVPPLRLKARPRSGVAADALVAHTLPTTFAFLELGSAGTRGWTWWIAGAAGIAWSTGFGIRSIVVHQIQDADGDRAAGVGTYVVERGVPRAARLGRDAFAVEFLGLIAIFAVTLVTAWGVALYFTVHFGLWLSQRRFDQPDIDTVPTSPGAWLPLAEFYEVWPAVAFGVALTWRDRPWAWLLAGIVVVFRSAVQKQVLDEFRLARDLFADWWRRAAGLVGEHVVKHVQGVIWPAVVRLWHQAGGGLRRAWWAVYRGFWRVNRRIWRFRHAIIDPIIAFARRQRRRVGRRWSDLRRHADGGTGPA